MTLQAIDIVRTRSAPDLLQRALQLKQAEPGLRARDLAARLGVSEGELVAARCGEGVVRLAPRWTELLPALPELGRVMALTRNEQVVHEKHGRYDNVSVSGRMGLVLDPEIDLRLFLDHWSFGFAVEEPAKGGPRPSLQFFDTDGTAVHKIFLTRESDEAGYRALVSRFRHADQTAGQDVQPHRRPKTDRPDGEIDVADLRGRWAALEDTHDFFALLKNVGTGREQAFRLAGESFAKPVPPAAFTAAVEQAAAMGMPVMIFVGSPGVVQIHSGPVSNLKVVGPWFNILDPGFNLHLRQDGVASCWVVRKPTRDGDVTSIEIFDAEGTQLAWMFGYRKPGASEREDWRTLANQLAAAN